MAAPRPALRSGEVSSAYRTSSKVRKRAGIRSVVPFTAIVSDPADVPAGCGEGGMPSKTKSR